MRESDDKRGFTAVDHITYDIILPLLSTTAQSIYMRIYRQTIGWHKTNDKIAHSHFRKYCNIKSHETINSAVEELKELRLIIVLPEDAEKGKIKEYSLNMKTLCDYRDRQEAGEFDE